MKGNTSACLINSSNKFRTLATLLQEGKSGVAKKLLIDLGYFVLLLSKIEWIFIVTLNRKAGQLNNPAN